MKHRNDCKKDSPEHVLPRAISEVQPLLWEKRRDNAFSGKEIPIPEAVAA